MKIEIVRQTVANAGNVFKGDVLDVTDAVGRSLIRTGKAIECKTVAAKPKQAQSAEPEADAPSRVTSAPRRKVKRPATKSKSKED